MLIETDHGTLTLCVAGATRREKHAAGLELARKLLADLVAPKTTCMIEGE